MIRVHANAVEYVPLGLLLLGFYELDHGWPASAARRRHRPRSSAACCMSRECWNTAALNFGRAAGPTLTWITIAALAVLNLWRPIR